MKIKQLILLFPFILSLSCTTYKKAETFVPNNKKEDINKYKLTNYLSYSDNVIEQTPIGVENFSVMDEFYISYINHQKVCFQGIIRTEISVDQDLTQYTFTINKKKIYPLITTDSINKFNYEYTGTQEISGFKLRGLGISNNGGVLGNLGFSKRETKQLLYSVNERHFSFCTEQIEPGLIEEKINLQIELKINSSYKIGSNYIWNFKM